MVFLMDNEKLFVGKRKEASHKAIEQLNNNGQTMRVIIIELVVFLLLTYLVYIFIPYCSVCRMRGL
jgi:hypothetical protein